MQTSVRKMLSTHLYSCGPCKLHYQPHKKNMSTGALWFESGQKPVVGKSQTLVGNYCSYFDQRIWFSYQIFLSKYLFLCSNNTIAFVCSQGSFFCSRQRNAENKWVLKVQVKVEHLKFKGYCRGGRKKVSTRESDGVESCLPDLAWHFTINSKHLWLREILAQKWADEHFVTESGTAPNIPPLSDDV